MGAAYKRHLHGLEVPAALLCMSLYVSYWQLLFLSVASYGNPDNYSCLHQKCGNVRVPYPFTIDRNISTCPSFKISHSDANFTLNCTNDALYLDDKPVLRILEDAIILNLSDFKASNASGLGCPASSTASLSIYIDFPDGGPFVSAADNHFVTFGCGAGFLFTTENSSATAFETGGCQPFCGTAPFLLSHQNQSIDRGCGNDRNCCVSVFPSPALTTEYTVLSLIDISCSSFAIPYHPNFTNFQSNTYGLKVIWALPDPHVLAQLKAYNPTFNVSELPGDILTACSPNQSSQLSLVSEGVPGYRCSCLPGYDGDGYTDGSGCLDVDECGNATLHLCVEQSKCHNERGNYTCHCTSRWHRGDGRRNGVGCRVSPNLIRTFKIAAGIASVVLLLVCILITKTRMDRKKKHKYFQQNCGLELQAYIAAETGRQTTRFFTAQELRDATQNFSENLKLGTGGFGTVYRGTLKDGNVVAIKKSNQPGDVDDRRQFLNEMTILTQIHHRNIVRLYGCCLETANPLLVYEFVSNGDLAEKLASKKAVMRWVERLQVATQVAEAVAYLHTKLSQPVLHRDLKTANILLDDNLDAKVADFGISRLIPEGENCVSTVVQGTLGYLDPEYFQTLQLTDKSDVYSLGVVLVELITGLKAVDTHSRGVRFANLALLFLEMVEQGRVQELVDPRLDEVETAADAEALRRLHNSIQEVAEVAQSCLALKGRRRPSMSELALKLLQITSALTEQGLRSCASFDSETMTRPLLSTVFSDNFVGR